MFNDWTGIFLHLFAAALAGGLIGFERSYHGRPAGFRTHTLVCVASSLLMLVTLYWGRWFTGAAMDTVKIDPTRMAQGVMTGIGFLGAGVIIREGIAVRGLTTAASIWITAAIGILAGVGFYGAVTMATALTLGILAGFRFLEYKMPSQIYAQQRLLFKRDNIMSEAEITEVLKQHGFTVANISYKLLDLGEHLECRMTIRTLDKKNIEKLAKTFMNTEAVIEFNISQAGG